MSSENPLTLKIPRHSQQCLWKVSFLYLKSEERISTNLYNNTDYDWRTAANLYNVKKTSYYVYGLCLWSLLPYMFPKLKTCATGKRDGGVSLWNIYFFTAICGSFCCRWRPLNQCFPALSISWCFYLFPPFQFQKVVW